MALQTLGTLQMVWRQLSAFKTSRHSPVSQGAQMVLTLKVIPFILNEHHRSMIRMCELSSTFPRCSPTPHLDYTDYVLHLNHIIYPKISVIFIPKTAPSK
jgi:hypothetical protein